MFYFLPLSMFGVYIYRHSWSKCARWGAGVKQLQAIHIHTETCHILHRSIKTFHTRKAKHVPCTHKPDTKMLATCMPRIELYVAYPIDHTHTHTHTRLTSTPCTQSRTEVSQIGPHPSQDWTNRQTEAQRRHLALHTGPNRPTTLTLPPSTLC